MDQLLAMAAWTYHHRHDAQLPVGPHLVVKEVHRPQIDQPDRRHAILTQLGLDRPLANLVMQWQARARLKSIDVLHVHRPTIVAQSTIAA